jgi:pimeloyl-ACP methyl ester carboxylesterase
MRKLLTVSAVLTLLIGVAAVPSAQAVPATAVASAGANAAAAWKPAPVAWAACTEEALEGLECGKLEVPLDYAKPGGAKIKLALSRAKHTAKKYQGIMLANPGGPGGAGRQTAYVGFSIPKKAGAQFDWIGFDPRGVGASEPALACDPSYGGYHRPDYVPTSPEGELAWWSKAKGYAATCDKVGGEVLEHLKTTDSVKDMDSIRVALGQKKLSFYGFSYGTYLAQVYATTYPTRVGRMVLDGVVNPARVWYKANLDQDYAFDANAKRWFAWIAKNNKKYRLGSTAKQVEARYYTAQHRIAAAPAGGKIGPSEWSDIFLSAGYSATAWPWLADLFAAWVHTANPKGLIEAYGAMDPADPQADNGYAMYAATQCTDVAWPKTWNTWLKDNATAHAKAPFMSWSNTWFNAPCLFWGAKAGKPVQVNGKKAPKILLISETYDAATPFSGALEVRKRFPKSALVEGVNGTTHSASLSGIACVDNTIADYLLTGKLPKRVKGNKADRRCGAVRPTATEALTRQSGPHRGELPNRLNPTGRF